MSITNPKTKAEQKYWESLKKYPYYTYDIKIKTGKPDEVSSLWRTNDEVMYELTHPDISKYYITQAGKFSLPQMDKIVTAVKMDIYGNKWIHHRWETLGELKFTRRYPTEFDCPTAIAVMNDIMLQNWKKGQTNTKQKRR